MTTPRFMKTAAALLSALLLTSCAGAATPAAPSSPSQALTEDGVDTGGAKELSTPARALVLADERGELTLIDLASEQREIIAPSGEALDSLDSTGRFLFLGRHGGDRGATSRVDIVDSGRWTQPHGDHSHYFAGDARHLGAVDGDGPAHVGIGSDGTAIAFGDSHAVIMEHEALAEEGAVAATPAPVAGPAIPFAGELLVATASGIEVPGAPAAPCAHPADADITRVGAVFACADGAVLVTREVGGALAAEAIPLPTGAVAAASELAGRPDRPDLAGVAGGTGAWLLDVRARTWTLLPSDTPLVRATAIGDDDSRTAALAADGSVRILGADGAVQARTEPLLAASVADPALRERVQLLVDADRAYVTDPAAGAVHVIDLDDAHIACTVDAPRVHAIALVG